MWPGLAHCLALLQASSSNSSSSSAAASPVPPSQVPSHNSSGSPAPCGAALQLSSAACGLLAAAVQAGASPRLPLHSLELLALVSELASLRLGQGPAAAAAAAHAGMLRLLAVCMPACAAAAAVAPAPVGLQHAALQVAQAATASLELACRTLAAPAGPGLDGPNADASVLSVLQLARTVLLHVPLLLLVPQPMAAAAVPGAAPRLLLGAVVDVAASCCSSAGCLDSDTCRCAPGAD